MNPIRPLLIAGLFASVSASLPAEEPKAPVSPAPTATPGKEAAPAAPFQPPKLLAPLGFKGTLDGLDGDRKTISFTTDDGKSYTLPVEMPGSPEAQERALALAATLTPGAKIVVFCRVNEKKEPTVATGLRMVGPGAPSQFR